MVVNKGHTLALYKHKEQREIENIVSYSNMGGLSPRLSKVDPKSYIQDYNHKILNINLLKLITYNCRTNASRLLIQVVKQNHWQNRYFDKGVTTYYPANFLWLLVNFVGQQDCTTYAVCNENKIGGSLAHNDSRFILLQAWIP
jgi:hypothetical protein